MKKSLGLILAICGILVLSGIIFYQYRYQADALFVVPIGLALTFSGVFILLRSGKTK